MTVFLSMSNNLCVILAGRCNQELDWGSEGEVDEG